MFGLKLSIMKWRNGGQGISPATALIASDWNGFGLDFTSNTYAMRTSTAVEQLLGGTPSNLETGSAIDLTSNSYVVNI